MRLNLDPTALKSSYTFLKLSTAVLPPSGRLPIVVMLLWPAASTSTIATIASSNLVVDGRLLLCGHGASGASENNNVQQPNAPNRDRITTTRNDCSSLEAACRPRPRSRCRSTPSVHSARAAESLLMCEHNDFRWLWTESAVKQRFGHAFQMSSLNCDCSTAPPCRFVGAKACMWRIALLT